MVYIKLSGIDVGWSDLTLDSIINDVAPKEAEDDGAGGEEMEDGDFNFSNSEWKA